jgi:hypothetical protein
MKGVEVVARLVEYAWVSIDGQNMDVGKPGRR